MYNIIKNQLKKYQTIYFFLYYFKEKLKGNYSKSNIIENYKWLTNNNEKFIFIASFYSSGWNLIKNVLNYYYNKKLYKKNFLEFDQDNYLYTKKFKTEINTVTDLRGTDQLYKEVLTPFKLIHTHYSLKDTPFLKQRFNSKKKIFLIRDPLSTLKSFFNKKKAGKNFNQTFEEFKKEWLYKLIDFYNSYELYLLDEKNTHLIFAKDLYSETQKKETFKKIFKFCNDFEIEEEILNEALDFYSLVNEKSRNKKNIKWYKMGLANYIHLYSEHEKEYILNELKSKLNPNVYHLFKKESLV